MLYINHVINYLRGNRRSDVIVPIKQTKYFYYNKYKWIIIPLLITIGSLLTYNQLFNAQTHISLTTLDATHNNKAYSYQITPVLNNIGKGALINDIDLCEIFETTPSNQVQSLITKIKADVYKYEFIVFKHQCNHKNNNLSPETFAMIASAFGTISHYTSKGHSAEPNDTDITVLSNDPTKGHTLTGAQGWHVDGSNKLSPDGIVFQYVMAAPNKGYGGTQFISSEAMIELMKNTNKELYNRLNRLYMAARNSVKPARIHPLIGKHPITNKEYMVIHTAFTKQFIQVKDESMIEIDKLFLGQRVDDIFIETYQNDNRIEKIYSKEETQDLLAVILEFIEKDCRENGLIFVTDYDKGDLLIRDNWAMLHTSHPSAHFDVKEVGLRVIWRLTTDGKFIPSKF
eukprot:507145_1